MSSPTLASLTYSELAASTSVAAASLGGSASLSGFFYVDLNGNGVMDSTDWGISEAKISITQVGSSDPLLVVSTNDDGSYSFTSLLPGDYTIAVLTHSPQLGQDKGTLAALYDKGGQVVTQNNGIPGSQDQYANITVGDGYKGVFYDFADTMYPAQLLTKRMLLNNNPGVHLVPEPGSWMLLAIAGLFCGSLAWRRRRMPAA